MTFGDLAHALEEISQHSSRTTITTHLARIFENASPEEAQIISYLVLGALRPPYRGTQFTIAEKTMLKIVAALLDESLEKVTRDVKQKGDVSLLIADDAWRSTKALTVLDVYSALENIEAVTGEGSQEKKIDELQKLLRELDPVGVRCVIKMVIGKLRLGFSDMTVLDALSWMLVGNKSLHGELEDAYNRCADLGLIAAIARAHGAKGLQAVTITVGIPIRPAAAERLPTAADIVKKIGPCVAQPKIDGFRVQVHADFRHGAKRVWFYSRNLIDMSEAFPELKRAVEKLDVQTLIAEGEAIVYHEETDTYLPFQETAKRKRKHDVEETAQELPLTLFIFDMLFCDGKSLLALGHEERRSQIEQVFHHKKNLGACRFIEEKKTKTAEELENYFLHMIEEGLEGIVAKRPDAPYQPGKRGFNWIKLKRHEASGATAKLNDTIDAVILGYYAGRGKRAHFGIGAFLVGVYNRTHDRFETIAKIGTGLKDDDWRALKKKCDQLAVSTKPHNVLCAADLEPDVWISPEIVCEIRADEITQSPVHSAGKTEKNLGLALRFPRFVQYRDDKSASDATTAREIRSLYDQQ